MEHRGVYGIWTNARGHVVLVRKSRGPYVGLLDLPGGSPEPGESSEETLLRELNEECGIRDVRVRSWHEFDLVVTQDSSGRPIDFRHSGLIAVLDVAEGPADVSGVEDVAAVEERDPCTLAADECSALLQQGLRLLGTSGGA